MRKRSAFIGVILSLIPFGQPLLIKTGVVLSTTSLMLSLPEKVNAVTSSFYFNRAYDKAERGDHYGAISDFTKAIEINPSEAAYYNRGNSKSDIKDYYGAISDYTKAIEINPQYAKAYVNRGWSKEKLEDNYGAISDYTKAIEINPTRDNAYGNRGIAKRKIGDDKGGCDDWRKASSLGNEITDQWVRDQC